MIRLAIFAATLATTTAATAQERLSVVDLVSSWRDLPNKTVTVDSCVIAGTAATFLRCESSNGGSQVILETATMDRRDLARALNDCPTGTGHSRLDKCSVTPTGMVEAGRSEPTLSSVRFAR